MLFVYILLSQHNKLNQDKPRDGVRGAGYTPIVKENARFVKYYQVMGKVLVILGWIIHMVQ